LAKYKDKKEDYANVFDSGKRKKELVEKL